MANSVESDETTRYELSHLDWHFLQRYLYWSEGMKGLEKFYTFRGGNSVQKMFCLPSENGSALKENNFLPFTRICFQEFAPLGSKFLPFRVDTFSKWV